ncbi:HYR domain-containing protein [Archangium violaceum]|uniref:ELWxxDGT repeat protein n=1 Tax=Archangium violaceum TaxID=83451 RepID=UPI00193BB490|nr:ELWxxDGT repeat protein [Archangium violaceum]QRK09064.1 HYR domain-containing protein [Archangium violaceum]
MSRRTLEWLCPLALVLTGGSAPLAHAEATPLPGCRPPAAMKDVARGSDSSSPSSFLRMGGTLYFVASDGESGAELWKSDGTEDGTVRVKDINPGAAGSRPSLMTALDGVLLFSANDGVHGSELFRSDGTEAGTVMVREIGEGLEASGITDMLVMNGKIFLAAADHVAGRELWETDGTFHGTKLVADILPGDRSSITARSMRLLGNDTLFFAADDGIHGFELWTSDGTRAGTRLVKDIAPGATNANPGQLTVVGGTLYFTATDGTAASELWKSDGTEAGTVRVKDSAGRTITSPESLKAAGDKLFFRLKDAEYGSEPWVSDGTEQGTRLLADIFEGSTGSTPNAFTDLNGTLYFTANDGVSGVELWKSDGTEEGTVLVKELRAGSLGSSPQSLTAGGSMLFFSADDGNGFNLWMSDGTEEGTRLAAPELAIRDPQQLTFTGDALYFSADDGLRGREPYSVSPAFFGDCTPPSLTCPESVTVEATGRSGALVGYGPARASDDGAVAPTVSYSQESGTAFPVKDNVVTVTATDAAGNTNTCTFTVAVKDTRAPLLTCPADVEASATSREGAVINYSPAQAMDTASDVILDYSTPPGATFPPGDTRVQVTATDASGNAATCSFSVKVGAAPSTTESGCGCTSGLAADAPWLLLGALAPLMARRRRSS